MKTEKYYDAYIGEVFDMLTIKKFAYVKNSRPFFECQCECGNIKIIMLNSMQQGNTKSCGCLQKNKAGKVLSEKMKYGTNLNNLNRKKIQSNNSLGVKGVMFDKVRNKYRTYIGFQKKQVKGGYYDTLEEAIEERKKLEAIYHAPIKIKHFILKDDIWSVDELIEIIKQFDYTINITDKDTLSKKSEFSLTYEKSMLIVEYDTWMYNEKSLYISIKNVHVFINAEKLNDNKSNNDMHTEEF